MRGWRRLAAAHLTIDESTAVAAAQPEPAASRIGSWVTGIGVFLLWNAFVLVAALACYALKLGGHLIPRAWLASERVSRITTLVTVALLVSLVVVQGFADGRTLTVDARGRGTGARPARAVHRGGGARGGHSSGPARTGLGLTGRTPWSNGPAMLPLGWPGGTVSRDR